MNLSQTHADVEINKAEVMNMIQNGMSCDSVSKYFDLRGEYPYNYDLKSECRYIDTLKNNGFRITTSILQVDLRGKKSKRYYKFTNWVLVEDLTTKFMYTFSFTYVPNINKWCLRRIVKPRD